MVDLETDFADSVGWLSVRGGAEILPLVNAEIDRARDRDEDRCAVSSGHFEDRGTTKRC